ncbi:leucine-rich repeat-containing protein 46 isoform X1 [Chiroxiphia lanceolata]|uniref:leucine-rich repeat-containing protein 46 isoform X1 n=1 Tax=Chiroxiphia lanceolata TaxID=296741 RepID=UPI0013CEBEE3|nr:leucine-rich repeat-containing protein 46 isoform X1 [Chiroxiphia lanceolata]XP_032567239.1 leucine-rich repeat-containing protein 46 isoform X1 [Chiroxiphia lanceolata]
MSEQEEKTLCGDHEGTSPGVTLSDSLVLTRSRSTELLPPSTIRLDRENISSIGKLQDQGGIHSLYLQQNKIERIENLGCFPNLRYGSSYFQGNGFPRAPTFPWPGRGLKFQPLGAVTSPSHPPLCSPGSSAWLETASRGWRTCSPCLTSVPWTCPTTSSRSWTQVGSRKGSQGCQCVCVEYPFPPSLPQFSQLWGVRAALGVALGVGEELGEFGGAGIWLGRGGGLRSHLGTFVLPFVLAEELPRSLQILDLTGNECTRQQGYRELVLGALPHLLQLDAQPLRGKEEEGGGSSRGEDEDDELLPEPGGPFTVDRGFFADLRRELVGRSQRRRRETLEEHRARLEELQERRDLLLSRDRDGAPGPAAPQPQQGHSRPRAQPGTPLRGSRGSQRAPGGVQSRSKALEKETGAKGTGNRQLSQISRSSAAQRGRE